MDGIQCFVEPVGKYFGEEDLKLQIKATGDMTKYEKRLCSGHITCIFTFLKNNGFQHQLLSGTVAAAVCRCLLYTTSCHSDPATVVAAADALSFQLGADANWTPDRPQVLAIALNWGLEDRYLPPDFEKSELPHREKQAQPSARKPDLVNVEQTLMCVTELLWPDAGWSVQTLDALFAVLVAMLVDTNMQQLLITPRLTHCIHRLINTYNKTVWENQVKLLDLVEGLGDLPAAAQLCLLAGLPVRGRRCQTLRKVTAYYYLQLALNAPEIDLPNNVTVENVLQRLPAERLPCDSQQDLHRLFMLLSLIDAAVGSDRLPAQQRAKLSLLQIRIQPDVDRVRENIDDKCVVVMRLKELMTRLNSKWKCMTETPHIQTTLESFSIGSQRS